MRTLAHLVLALSFVLGLAACDDRTFPPTPDPKDAPPVTQPPAPADDAAAARRAVPPGLAPMLSRVSPAVVNISVEGSVRVAQNPLFQDPFFRHFFNLPGGAGRVRPRERFQAVGSGVIYDAQHGYVITNNHVVANADKILVTLNDRRQFDAKLVATDPQTDIAVLKIKADGLTNLQLGDSKRLKVGDYVVAIGNPFGVGQTATFGIVSAVGRTGLGIEGYENFIQTDASINPGNSGGALVDVSGRLIGMNTAILSQSGGNVGIGFAIPIEMVKSIAGQLIADGKVTRGELGVAIQDLTPALANAMGIKATSGVVVAQVKPGSAADNAGLAEGDVITALDGDTVTSSAELRNEIGERAPGTVVELKVTHDGESRTVRATLKTLETTEKVDATPSGGGDHAPALGLSVAPIPRNDPRFGRTQGIIVADVDPGSEADDAGLQEGDIIVSAAREPVRRPSDLARIVQAHKKSTPLLLQVWRNDTPLFVAVG